MPNKMIERRIYIIRGQRIMLDNDLADLYEVITGNLNLAVYRNIERFPNDFMFRLTSTEYQSLILQIAISKRGGRRHLPYAFTEQGVAMLSSVLNSKRAIAVNIAIMRAFVKLRQLMTGNKPLAKEIEKLETEQKRQHIDISLIFYVIEKLFKKEEKPKAKIGFRI